MMLRLSCSMMALLLLAGCLGGSMDDPAGPGVAVSVREPGVPETRLNPDCCDAASETAGPGVDEPVLETGAEADLALAEALAVEPELPLDAETLADNLLLQGVDQTPPEEAGETIAHPEPAFDFPMVENDKVRYFIDYFSGRGQKTFRVWLERSTRYLPMMQEVFAEAGLPRDLAYLAMVESGFNDKAYSWAHAVGPWQFIESTGKRYDLHNDWWHDERRDPVKATRAAARFLSDLYVQFDGDWYLAVPAYNAGPGKIRTAIRKYNTRDFWELSKGSYLRNETKNYLPKLLAAIFIAKQPDKYGFTDLNDQPPLAYDTAILPSSTDLDVIASLSGTDYRQLKALNPELKRWCTPPGSDDYEVRLPPGTGQGFIEKYLDLPPAQRANYVRHKIRSGDTLGGLASRYGVRVSDIKRLNRISNPRALQIGNNLLIPLNPDFSRRAVAELKDDYQRSRRASYTVRSGDSLWSISRRFGVTEKQLRVWNRLGWSNVIRPGQTLVVAASAGKPATAASRNSGNGATTEIVYQVQPGDTLWGIGRQFAVGTDQILDWNNLDQGHVLKAGERLTLRVTGQTRG